MPEDIDIDSQHQAEHLKELRKYRNIIYTVLSVFSIIVIIEFLRLVIMFDESKYAEDKNKRDKIDQ